MDIEQIDLTPVWVPRACTLPTAERPLRVAEFDGLFGAALRDVHRPRRTELRLILDGTAEVAARVADLVERETRCCSFFTFTLSRDGDDQLLLRVRVPSAHVGVLDGLHTRATTALENGRE